MPGLKALADRVEGPRQSRAISFYTSTFGVGGSFSLWLAGAVAGAFGWRWAFGLAAAGPLAAAALVLAGLSPRPPARAPGGALAHLARLAPVVRDRATRRYIVGYAVHCWELFGVRAWMVAFLAFAAARTPAHAMPWAAATVAAAINLLGPPASILGNEAAARGGRLRYVSLVMAASIVAAALVGFTSAWSWTAALAGLTVYLVIVMADRRRSRRAWWLPRHPRRAAPRWPWTAGGVRRGVRGAAGVRRDARCDGRRDAARVGRGIRQPRRPDRHRPGGRNHRARPRQRCAVIASRRIRVHVQSPRSPRGPRRSCHAAGRAPPCPVVQPSWSTQVVVFQARHVTRHEKQRDGVSCHPARMRPPRFRGEDVDLPEVPA